MSTLTLELDAGLARSLEESARREHKPMAAWAREKLRLAAIEEEAAANGYPVGWIRLFMSIEDETFVAPSRTPADKIHSLDEA